MTNKTQTDNETIKAFECCSNSNDLINQQKAELAELKSENKVLKDSNKNLQELYEAEKERVAKAKEKCIGIAKALKTAKAEAVKEFAKKAKALFPSDNEPYQYWEIHEGIDNLLKEMVGD